MNIILPMGGRGERFIKEGYNKNVPKPFIPIFNKRMVEYVLDNISFGPDDTIFIIYNVKMDVSPLREYIHLKHSLQNQNPSIQLIEIHQETRGATETILLGLDVIFSRHKYHENTLFVDCDTFYTYDIVNTFRRCCYDKKEGECDNMVFYRKVAEDTPPLYSFISFHPETNHIADVKEKEKISVNANTGAYAFGNIHQFYKAGKTVLENPDKWYKNEPYVSCVIRQMLEEGATFIGEEIPPTTVFSLGTPKEVELYKENTHAFLLDLDGTLVLTEDIYFTVWETILKGYNLQLTKDVFKRYIEGNTDTYVINTLLKGIDVSLKEISTQKDRLFLENIDKIRVIAGATEMIDRIREAGHKCCIVTNSNRAVASSIVQKIGIYRKIDFMICAEDCSRGKPHPDPYTKAIQQYGISNHKCIIIEDSKSGLLSAKSTNPLFIIGIETIYTREELRSLGITKTMKDYTLFRLEDYLHLHNNPNEDMGNNENDIRRAFSIENRNERIENLRINENKLKGGFIADIISMKIQTNIRDYDLVYKYEVPNTSDLSTMAKRMDFYEREYYFYETISPYITSIPIPRFYSLIKDEETNTNKGVLLEDLFQSKRGDYRINLNLNTEKVEVSLKVIENMVKLHTQFWNKNLLQMFPSLKRADDPIFNPFMGNYIKERTPLFKEKWKHIITEEENAIYDWMMGEFENNQRILSSGPNTTLLHGDIKSPNIFYDVSKDYEPCFIDWQHMEMGKGTQDLLFFIIESFDMENLPIYYPLFKMYYYKKLLEYGITDYSLTEYENDIKRAMCYTPFFTAVWFGTVPDDDLIDKNFPFFFIRKMFYLCKNFVFCNTK